MPTANRPLPTADCQLPTADRPLPTADFLASDSASFVTGEILAVDGGFMAQGIGDSVVV